MIKRPTHTWLKPVLDQLEGYVATGLGSATSLHAFYGQHGIAQVPTGGNGILSATFLGASGFGATLIAASGVALSASGMAIFLSRFADNGGSGTPHTFGDVVCQLKNMGILKR